jgi:hypothetical protein
MAKKERNRGSVDRARAKRGTTPSSERSRDDDYLRQIYEVPAANDLAVSLRRLARRHAPQEEAILRRPPRAINLCRALPDWQSEQTCAKPWTLLMPRSAPPSVKPPTVRWA